MSGWDSLGIQLSEHVCECIGLLGFVKPTPVQAATIPQLLKNKDAVVEAVTGSGKTLAFAIPIVEKLIQDRRRTGMVKAKAKERKDTNSTTTTTARTSKIHTLVLSPTRELAQQIALTFERDLRVSVLGFTVATFVGGTDVAAETAAFHSKGGDIIVATPGRLIDALGRDERLGRELREAEMLILDEADRLLDCGFEQSIGKILKALPKQRRTSLFSATMTDSVGELVRAGLRNPVKITLLGAAALGASADGTQHQRIPDSLKIFYQICPYTERFGRLLEWLETEHQKEKCIVYFATCACVEYFWKLVLAIQKENPSKLIMRQRTFLPLHGKMEQKRRIAVYQEFCNMAPEMGPVLFCTDVAARGLDFANVGGVIQMDPPQDPSTFAHRCGRTARGGQTGKALVFLESFEQAYVDLLLNRRIPMEPVERANNTNNDNLQIDCKRLNVSDRDLYEKSTRAFVSYIRFYQEHMAKFIFRLANLDIGALATAFGLLRLPRMPELKLLKVSSGFQEDRSVNTDQITYKDKTRERQRQANLAKAAAVERLPKVTKPTTVKREAWSETKARKQRREERRDKKAKKREAEREDADVDESSNEDAAEEWKEYKKELREAKRAKQHA